MGSIKADTLNALAKRKYLAKVTCRSCGRTVRRNPATLMTAVHALKGSMDLEQAARLLRCSRCGQRAAFIEPAMQDP